MRRLLLTTLLAAWLGPPVAAQSLGLSESEIIAADLLSGWETAQGTHMAGLRFRLAPGWKTYWRAPGDSGIPPQFEFTGSENLSAMTIHWPRPDVFFQNGVRTIGYAGDVVIPIELTPKREGAPMAIDGLVDLGVCADVCVPLSVQVSGALTAPGTRTPAIVAALLDQPISAAEAGVESVGCRIAATPDGVALTATIVLPATGSREVAVFEHPDPTVWVAEATVDREGKALRAVTEFVPTTDAPMLLDRSALRITVIGDGVAVDIEGCSGS